MFKQKSFTFQSYLGFLILSLGLQMNLFLIHNKKRSHLPLSTHSSNGVQTKNVFENTTIFSNIVKVWSIIDFNNFNQEHLKKKRKKRCNCMQLQNVTNIHTSLKQKGKEWLFLHLVRLMLKKTWREFCFHPSSHLHIDMNKHKQKHELRIKLIFAPKLV